MVCVEACRRPGRGVITGARSLQGRPLCCVQACFPAAAWPLRHAMSAAGGARHVCATSVLRFGKLKRLCGREDRPGGTKKNLRAGHTLQGTTAAACLSQPYSSAQIASSGGAKRLCPDARDKKPPAAAFRHAAEGWPHDVPGTAGQAVCLSARPRHADGILCLRVIFVPRGHSAAQVAFLFVCAQHALHFPV